MKTPTDQKLIAEGLPLGCASFVHEQGSVQTSCDELRGWLEAGRARYSANVDPAGAMETLDGLMLDLGKPTGVTPWGEPYGQIGTETVYGYFSIDFGPFIELYDPKALAHEITHYLDWKLHPTLQVESNGAMVYRWQIIGHGIEGDPLQGK